MVLRERQCFNCGLWSDYINNNGFCKACEKNYRIEQHLLKQKKNIEKGFNYTPIKLVEKKKDNPQKFNLWFSEPRLQELFANEKSFTMWSIKNKNKFEGFEQLIKYRVFCLKLISKKILIKEEKLYKFHY